MRCATHPGWERATCVWCGHREAINLTAKDKLWEFRAIHLPGRPSVRTKGQWRRYLKTHHLTDDLTRREIIRQAARGPGRSDIREFARRRAEAAWRMQHTITRGRDDGGSRQAGGE